MSTRPKTPHDDPVNRFVAEAHRKKVTQEIGPQLFIRSDYVELRDDDFLAEAPPTIKLAVLTPPQNGLESPARRSEHLYRSRT